MKATQHLPQNEKNRDVSANKIHAFLLQSQTGQPNQIVHAK